MDKTSNLILGLHPRKSFGFADFRQSKASGFLEPHVHVVVFLAENGMLMMRDAVAIPAQEYRQVIVDICLCKFVRKLQHSLSYFETIVIDCTY